MKYIKIEDVPVGSQFKAPKQPTKRTKKEVEEANMWWKTLNDNQKCLIYWDYLEKVDIEEIEK